MWNRYRRKDIIDHKSYEIKLKDGVYFKNVKFKHHISSNSFITNSAIYHPSLKMRCNECSDGEIYYCINDKLIKYVRSV